jgi:hypothetical protein
MESMTSTPSGADTGALKQVRILDGSDQPFNAAGLIMAVGTTLNLKAAMYNLSGQYLEPAAVLWSLKQVSGGLDSGLACPGIATASCAFTPTQLGSVIIEGTFIGTDSGVVGPMASSSVIQVIPLTTASSLELVSGNNQVVIANSDSSMPLKVKAKDSFGQPVSGVIISFLVTGGGGSISSGNSVVTDANGEASATLMAGTVAGNLNNTVVAQVVSNPGLIQTFQASTQAAAPHHISYLTQPAGSYSLLALSSQPVVQLRDQFENIITTGSGLVSLSVQTGTGVLAGTTALSMINGTATFSNVTYSVAEPGIVIRATSGSFNVDSVPFVVATSGGTVDRDPDDINFTSSVAYLPGASGRTTSNSVGIAGVGVPIDISVSGAGNPKLKLNGGSEVSSLVGVNVGATLEIVADAPTIQGTRNTITVYVGSRIESWALGYADSSRVVPIFLTNASYDGKFGSLSAGNGLCQSAAVAAGYSGTWLAVLGDSSTALREVIPWNFGQVRRMDGVVIANSFADFLDGTWSAPVNITETLATKNSEVWWGNDTLGENSSGTMSCQNWNASANGYMGFSLNSALSVLSVSQVNCDVVTYGLFCMGDPSGAVDSDPTSVEFLSQVSYSSGTRVSSNTVILSGITTAVSVAVSGAAGNPKLKINGGAEITSGTASFGDSIQIIMDAPTVLGTKNTVTVTLGTDVITWWVGYADSSREMGIFVSDIEVYGNTFGGTAAFDSSCQSKAVAAGLTGTWKALLSDTTQGGGPRARINFNWGVVKRVDGVSVATSWDDLWDGTLAAPINRDQNGVIRAGEVWTASKPSGEISITSGSVGTCENWTSGALSSTYGLSSSTSSGWIQTATLPCYLYAAYYYCYQETHLVDDLPVPIYFPMEVATLAGAGGRSTSVAVQVMGINTSVSVSVSAAAGNAKVKINGGAEVTSGTLSVGDSVQLVMDAPTVAGTKNTATLSVGSGTSTWSLGYANSALSAKVFVTSGSWGGSLHFYGGPDTLCQNTATTAGFGGTWKALISSSGTLARDLTPFNWGTLKRIDGATIAAGWSDLWDGAIQNPIDRDENGSTVSAGLVWTGSTSAGLLGVNTCGNWGTGLSGGIGVTSSTTGWIDFSVRECGYQSRLYCIEESTSEDLTPYNFSVPYKLFQPTSTRISSDVIPVTGITGAATVTLIGTQGSPTFKINGGAEIISGSVNNGDTITLVMTSPAALNQSHKVEVQIGNGSPVPWRIWTGDSNSGIQKRIFVTSTSYNANLGGPSGADAKCQARADTNSGLASATWKAIISNNMASEPEWAINRIGYNWSELWTINPDGSPRALVMTAGQIWNPAVSLNTPVEYTEAGALANSGSSSVWTGTSAYGFGATSDPCTSWTNDNVPGDTVYVGNRSSSLSQWVSSVSVSCHYSQYFSLYCIEQ